MNKKQYQKSTITIPGYSKATLSFQLRSDYQYATGIMFYSENSIAGVTCTLRIDGKEILPTGSDCTLFRWTEGISREEALWKFYEEKIEAPLRMVTCEFVNESYSENNISLYVLLENEQ